MALFTVSKETEAENRDLRKGRAVTSRAATTLFWYVYCIFDINHNSYSNAKVVIIHNSTYIFICF